MSASANFAGALKSVFTSLKYMEYVTSDIRELIDILRRLQDEGCELDASVFISVGPLGEVLVE